VGAVIKRLAIDPGDVHVGWAHHHPNPAWVVQVGEWKPTECCNEVIRLMTLDQVDELVIEEFILYEKDIKKQAWSKLQTSQLIGALKLIAYLFRVPVIEQGAYIKKPTRAQMRARGVKHQGKSIHTRDAEEHLYHRRLREAQSHE
jgi:hypothetical protein